MGITYYGISEADAAFDKVRTTLASFASPDTKLDACENRLSSDLRTLESLLENLGVQNPLKDFHTANWIDYIRVAGLTVEDAKIDITNKFQSVIADLEILRSSLDAANIVERQAYTSLYDRVKTLFPAGLGDDAELLAWLLVKAQTQDSSGTFHTYRSGRSLVATLNAPENIARIVAKGRLEFLANAGYLFISDHESLFSGGRQPVFSLTEKALDIVFFVESANKPKSTIQQTEDPIATNRAALRKLMTDRLKAEDLEVICFDLNLPTQNLSNSRHDVFVVKLIQECEQTDRRHQLLEACRDVRPNLDWSQFDAWANG